MDLRYYEYVPKNGLDISIGELAQAIAPVLEYSVVEITQEDTKDYNTYRIKVEFKKKKEIIPASMSITDDGKIILGTIVIQEEILGRVRKKAKK